MNARPDIEPIVSEWLHAAANAEGSDRVLAVSLVRVARLEQERGRRPLSLSNPRWLKRLTTVAAVAAVLAVAVVGINPSSDSANARIDGVWPSEPGVAFTVELPADAPEDMYWRVTMFDQWSASGRSWRVSEQTRTSVEAGATILAVISEPFAEEAMIEVPATIALADPGLPAVSPGIPVTIDQPIQITTTNPGGALAGIFLSRPRESYRITGALLAMESETTPNGISAAKLVAAGTVYPPEILAQFAVPPEDGELGEVSLAFISDIRKAVGDNPYEIAALVEQQFRSPEFTYDADMRDVDCEGRSFTECFMRLKRGYCMYYATGMIMLLRHQGIPARIVMGFLPGDRAGQVETVRDHHAHAWVEVYFPGWGWWMFDPTPRGNPRTIPLP